MGQRKTYHILSVIVLAGVGYLYFTKPHSKPAATGRAPASMPSVTEPWKKPSKTETPEPTTPNEKQKKLNDISETEKCLQSGTCPFPNDDPKAYEIAVGKKLTELLSDFHNRFKQDPGARKDLQTLGTHFMGSPDGFVQDEALKMLADLPPSAESLQAMVDGLSGSADALMMEKTLPELQKYLGTAEESKVHEFLSDTIARGGQFSSEKVSQNILPFINEKSYSNYQATLKTMSDKTTAARNLKSYLEEYQRIHTGG